MSKIIKLIEKMHNNPRDWNIEDIKNIAKRYDIDFHQPGTSHVTFRVKKSGEKVTIPAHKPIKPVYIKQFLALIESLRGDYE